MTETLVLTRRDVIDVLPMDACIDVVQRAFTLLARGLCDPPQVLGAHVAHGGFHVKTAGLSDGRHVYVAKVNANFPGNPERHGLPTIQGILVLFDGDTGKPLCVMDSIEITSIRTAAATAVAARFLARADAGVVTICGCGEQGRSQLRALALVQDIRSVFAYDTRPERARVYAQDMSAQLGIPVEPAADLKAATRQSDIIVTCTTATHFFIGVDDVRPGTFIAAVGADNPHKQEIDPALLAASTVVADILDQCATMGDLHHAIEAGMMRREDVHAELAQVVSGERAGRRAPDEVIIFDSTGTALQDVAAATLAYDRARAAGRGMRVAFGG